MRYRNLLLIFLIITIASSAYARWIKDKVQLDTESVGDVTFSHYNHLEAVGSDCPTCHNDIFHIVTEKNPAFTMAQMEKGKSCGACHNGNTAFTVKENCTICHAGEVAMKDRVVGTTPFPHSPHLDMGFSCDSCHPDLFRPEANSNTMTMAAMNQGESCGACHDGEMGFSVAENCLTCHSNAVDLTWENKDIGETSFPHSSHLDMGYGCDECHPDLFKPQHKGQTMTMDAMYEGEYCGACHDGEMAFSVEEDCQACHAM